MFSEIVILVPSHPEGVYPPKDPIGCYSLNGIHHPAKPDSE